jgi:hypothetical protein
MLSPPASCTSCQAEAIVSRPLQGSHSMQTFIPRSAPIRPRWASPFTAAVRSISGAITTPATTFAP